ncbi:MAG: DEAD/DEAH box helicase [Bacteroidales bacterium]|nr:DEAD/DEAH box helicase [Bacteroidales bacterium]
MKFEELDLSDELLDALYDMHFDECTPIQSMAIPAALEGNDLIAIAQTGTGKTAAYLIPIIDRLYAEAAPEEHVNCIIMAPTRELAQQIDRQMEGFSYFMPLSSVAIYGGTDGPEFARQQRSLKMGADVVIATPGRLIAHMQIGSVDLSKVSYFVLDEADRMLDMGFYDDIMQIVTKLPRERQTLMFSATMPPKIKQLAKTILNNPVEVKTAVSRPADGIDQSAIVCYDNQKAEILHHLFSTVHSRRVIVFVASKQKVKELTRDMRRRHWKVDEMHSDLEQSRRDDVMLDFRAGRTDILIATDIVARGIDIDDISMVVNFDVPREAEDYVHRVGRTARAGTDGRAITLVGPRDQMPFGRIEDFLGQEVRKETIPGQLGETPPYQPSRRRPNDRRRGSKGPHKSGRKDGRKNSLKDGKKDARKEQKPAAKAPAEAGGNGGNGGDKRRSHGRRSGGGQRRRSGKKPDISGTPNSTPKAE